MNDVCTAAGPKGTWEWNVAQAKGREPKWVWEVKKEGEEPVRFDITEKQTAENFALEIGGDLWMVDARQD